MDTVDPGGPLFASLDGDRIGKGHDARPTYPPGELVEDVKGLLRAKGINVGETASPYLAGIAAADLLRSLGVRPAVPPYAPPRSAQPTEPQRCRYCGRMPKNSDGMIKHVQGCRAETTA